MRSIFSNSAFSSKRDLADNLPQSNSNMDSRTSGIEWMYAVCLFLLPFFFLPFTTDLLNLNKTYLVLFISIASLAAFLFAGWRKGSLLVKDFKVYIPVIALLVAGAVSVFFSQNRYVSIYGEYGNYSASFIALVSLCLVTFVSSNIRINVARLVNFLIAGVTISTIASWLGLYKVSIPGLGALFPGFTLADSFSALLSLQLVAILGSFYLLMKSDARKSTVIGLMYGLAIIINASFGIINLNIFYLAILIFGLFYLAATSNISMKAHKMILIPIVIVTALIVVLNFIPAFRHSVGFDTNPNMPRMGLDSSWYVSAQSLVESPFWGTGLGSFTNDFTRFRPAFMNATPYWDIRYLYPFNDLFMWLATAGLFGVAAYMIFVLATAKRALKSRKEAGHYMPSYILLFALLSAFFMGGSLAINVLIFILAGVLLHSEQATVRAVKSRGVILGLTLVSILLFGLLSYNAYIVYAAQIAFRNSLQQESLVTRYELQRKAINLNPYESFYYREAVLTNLVTASRLSSAKDLTDDQKKQVEQLLVQAVSDSRVITEILDPRSSANWETRGLVYKSIIGLDTKTNKFSPLAAQSYLNAITNDRTNPKLYVDLGGIYYLNKDYQNAANYFVQAIQLKSDYANAYYNLAYALKDAGDPKDAVTQMQVVVRLIPEGTPASDNVKTELADLQKLADEAEKKAADAAAANASKIKVPEVTAPAASTDATADVTNPNDNQYNINSTSNVDSSKINADKVKPAAQTNIAPAADGSQPDAKAGQTNAPLAKPAAK